MDKTVPSARMGVMAGAFHSNAVSALELFRTVGVYNAIIVLEMLQMDALQDITC